MPKLKHLLISTAAFAAFALAPMAPAFADDASDEASFVAQINGLRAGLGIAPLAVDAGLTAKARAWAQTMAGQQKIWHSNLSEGITRPDWRKLGENVGMGPTVDGLHVAFVKSPHHYENLVDPTFTAIGLGVVRGANGVLFVAEEFMQVAPSAPPVVKPAPAASRPVRRVVKPKVKAKTRPSPVGSVRKGTGPNQPRVAASSPRPCRAATGRCRSATTRRPVPPVRASL